MVNTFMINVNGGVTYHNINKIKSVIIWLVLSSFYWTTGKLYDVYLGHICGKSSFMDQNELYKLPLLENYTERVRINDDLVPMMFGFRVFHFISQQHYLMPVGKLNPPKKKKNGYSHFPM